MGSYLIFYIQPEYFGVVLNVIVNNMLQLTIQYYIFNTKRW